YATTPSAIVTGRAADTAVPQPVLDLDCARLFSLPAFAAAYGAADVLHPVDVLGSEGFNTNLIPDADVLQTLGGISCDWSAGPPTSVDGDMAAPVEVTLAVLPNAAAQWAHFDASYGAANEGVHCYAPGPLNCWSDQLVGTNWVEIYMYGVGGEPEANALATAINTAVSSAGPGAAAWTPPHGTKTFGDCTQLLTPAQVATDLGVTATTIAFTTGEGGWSLREGAQANANAVGCLFQYADSDNTVGQVTWLRGGAWAHDAAIAASNPGWGSPAPAAIAGLAADDSATIRCNAPDPAAEEYTPVCTVDLLLGGNWLQVVISPDPGDDHLTATPRAAALAVAAHLVSGFNAHAH
ncbi:MAG: hypothetical protein ABIP33_05270, partial [Pseudolysinimonas sp.]